MFNQVGEIGRRATNRHADNIRDSCIIRQQAEAEFNEEHVTGSNSYSSITNKIEKFSNLLGK